MKSLLVLLLPISLIACVDPHGKNDIQTQSKHPLSKDSAIDISDELDYFKIVLIGQIDTAWLSDYPGLYKDTTSIENTGWYFKVSLDSVEYIPNGDTIFVSMKKLKGKRVSTNLQKNFFSNFERNRREYRAVVIPYSKSFK